MKLNRILLPAASASLLILALAAAIHRLYGTSYFTAGHAQSRHDQNELREGDIIFQTSRSAQSKAIQQATHSKYSHCGLLCKGPDNTFLVYEAVQPVKLTPLDQWIARGQDGHYVIKRLRNASQVLTPPVLERMKQAGKQYSGKSYDIYFEWSDNRIYCSELIWKIYKQATGLEIGKLQHFRDFDLASDNVQRILKKRYGNNIPLNEPVITPVSMFNSKLLVMVKEQ